VPVLFAFCSYGTGGFEVIGRTHRFHGINSLRHVYSRGQTVRGTLVTVKYLFNNKRSSYRAAVVVSRKVHKSAVVRNRIRRRIYEIIRRRQTEFAQPVDLVVTVFSEQIATLEAAALEDLMSDLLQRAGVLSEPADDSRAIVEQ
jgi:ribonuclease P protein component